MQALQTEADQLERELALLFLSQLCSYVEERYGPETEQYQSIGDLKTRLAVNCPERTR
jgi:hypothetical protein